VHDFPLSAPDWRTVYDFPLSAPDWKAVHDFPLFDTETDPDPAAPQRRLRPCSAMGRKFNQSKSGDGYDDLPEKGPSKCRVSATAPAQLPPGAVAAPLPPPPSHGTTAAAFAATPR